MKKQDAVKKGVLVGLGLAAFAKEKVDKIVADLLKKKHISPAEGKRVVKNVLQEAQKSGKRVAAVLEKELKHVLKTAKK